MLFDNNQTKGEANNDSRFIGRATSLETFSAKAIPIRLGTSSPIIKVKYVTTTTIITWATTKAYADGIKEESINAKGAAKDSPEYKPVRIPIKVIPICMVDKKRSGSLDKFNAVLAARLPFLASASRRDLRAETNAISDIDKTPFIKIRTIIIKISIFE